LGNVSAASVLAIIASVLPPMVGAQQTATSVATVTERGCFSQLNPAEIVLRHAVGCETRDCSSKTP